MQWQCRPSGGGVGLGREAEGLAVPETGQSLEVMLEFINLRLYLFHL